MDVVEQLKQDVRDGRVSVERLIELLVSLQRELQAARQSLEDARRRIAELEKRLGGAETVKFAESFSLRAEEQRQESRGKKKRKHHRSLRLGRVTTAEKIQQAQRTEKVFPVGVSHSDCQLSHTRPAWRLEEGHAAHLLRKAIQFTLLEPANAESRRFADRLLEIYRSACRAQCDGRLSDVGRPRKVAEFDDEILELCGPTYFAELPPSDGAANDFRRLCNELMRLMLAQELFTFVTAAAVTTPQGETRPVAGTNNEAERTLRSSATARKTGRTNKTIGGARRQTILVSVLESLRCFLPTYTLTTVIAEIQRWCDTGQCCFEQLLSTLQLTPPAKSLLDRLLPIPSG